MPLYDFHCAVCDDTFEALAPSDTVSKPCQTPECAGVAEKLIPVTHSFSVIAVTHLHSGKNKAGSIHLHQNRPKTPGKIQVGYGPQNHSRNGE